MKKKELVAVMAKKADVTQAQAEAVLKAFTDTVVEQVSAGDKVELVGFGSFDHADRAARTGRNPLTGETIKIKASKSPKFKAGKAFKDAINTPDKKSKKK